PLGNYHINLALARVLKFVALVFQQKYDEAYNIFKLYSQIFAGYIKNIPMLLPALQEFHNHYGPK
ncbi:MAG: hypothetical protein II939_14440, partial [Bacteroidales bacterium]|nr:hypothetical protein [Bacteroidales bacterium]